MFTRIGASDDLASGQSTFMVEMTEVAALLNHATSSFSSGEMYRSAFTVVCFLVQ